MLREIYVPVIYLKYFLKKLELYVIMFVVLHAFRP